MHATPYLTFVVHTTVMEHDCGSAFPMDRAAEFASSLCPELTHGSLPNFVPIITRDTLFYPLPFP